MTGVQTCALPISKVSKQEHLSIKTNPPPSSLYLVIEKIPILFRRYWRGFLSARMKGNLSRDIYLGKLVIKDLGFPGQCFDERDQSANRYFQELLLTMQEQVLEFSCDEAISGFKHD